ncbi:MAG: type II toxin-antitoxin system HicB family antitoxin [Magnetococcales bacterium]|nr:type II toxin-antitoxin system HicB family antitoxin [Magnetococcales bacterium]
MENKEMFDGFTVHTWQEPDDKDWMACLVEMPEISAFGPSPDRAIAELSVAWEMVKESCAANGTAIPVAPSRKNYSGQFNVRIAKTLHRRLAVEAAREGVSLNALVASKLELAC